MTSVFYDPLRHQITMVTDHGEWSSFVEDGHTVVSFENVDEVEFFWDSEEPLWRAV